MGNDPAVPGLGKYEVDSMNPNGRYPLSKFRNASCVTMGLRTDKKIIEKLCRYISEIIIIIVSSSKVGPGSYNTDTNLLSTMPKTLGYKFEISRRKSVCDV